MLLGERLVVLTGAGLSTDSEIPTTASVSPSRQPMTYQEFVSGSAARQRYGRAVTSASGGCVAPSRTRVNGPWLASIPIC